MKKEKVEPTDIIISYLTLRKAIGFLGIFLPAVLLLGIFTVGECSHMQDSISHYYFTVMGDVFVGILCVVALFLISYKGYDKLDNVVSTLAGIFALCVAFFATNQTKDISCATRFLNDSTLRIYTHYISAALYFISLAFISFFLFTKSKGVKTDRKIVRNRIYRTCGVVIIVSILLILLFRTNSWLIHNLGKFKPVFWLEWIALIAFGVSWLVKGEFMVKDRVGKDE